MNDPTNNESASLVGWKSRFDVALTTAHRIVLQGNVLDAVLDREQRPVGLVDWLVAGLREAGYRRIVCFDHGSDPVIHRWEDKEPREGLTALMQLGGGQPLTRRADPSNPLVVLNRLHRMLADPQVPAVCILKLQEQRFRMPSEEAVALHRLTAAAADASTAAEPNQPEQEGDTDAPVPAEGPVTPSTLRNLAVLLYSDDNLIPTEFLGVDPDTAVIRVPLPGYRERYEYFRRNKQAFHSVEGYQPEHLARITEGARLRELEQLARLSQQEQVGVGALPELQDLLHFGKRENPWTNIGSEADADRSLAPIRGQSEARDTVKDALLQGKWDIGKLIDPDARRPPLVRFFVGGTGVGKTMMARRMAEFLTGSPDGLKVIDMSEYRQDHSVQRLIGAPPSYIGFSEGGQLTNWVKERPFSLVLFDEIEKAHERILDIFLQILDGARLTDGKGETVDFSQTGLIFTSNIGTDALEDTAITSPQGRSPGNGREQIVDFFTTQVKEFFEEIERPEIFNRLKSGIVVFNYIGREDAKADITDKLHRITAGINARLGEQAQLREADDAVVERLLSHVDYERYGLRDVNNVLSTKLGKGISRFLDSAGLLEFGIQGTFGYQWIEEEDRLGITARGERA